jgi:DNA-binding MarR family transcriptional regulator
MSVVRDTRWLDESEQEIWRAFVTSIEALKEHLDRQLQHDSGMPYAYYEILVALSEAPDRTLRMSTLAGARGSSRSRLSHAVARLEQVGWVKRQVCPTDKRGSFATLTDEGFAALEAAAPGHVTTVREKIFDALTAEQLGTLGEISKAILAGLNCQDMAAAACAEAEERESGSAC